MCCDRFDRNCVNIDNTVTSNTHRTELREFTDGWPYQRLHWDLSAWSWPPVHSLLRIVVMGRTPKRITGTQTFPISKLGGLKHTTMFHILSKTNWHQMLKHQKLKIPWCQHSGPILPSTWFSHRKKINQENSALSPIQFLLELPALSISKLKLLFE